MAVRFTEEEIAEIKEVFTLFDKNGDGKLCSSELKIMFGGIITNPAASLLKLEDEKRELEFSEILSALSSIPLDSGKDYVVMVWTMLVLAAVKDTEIAKRAYKKYQADEKGNVCATELREFLEKNSPIEDPTSCKAIEAIDEVDRDKRDSNKRTVSDVFQILRPRVVTQGSVVSMGEAGIPTEVYVELRGRLSRMVTIEDMKETLADRLALMITPEEAKSPEKVEKAKELCSWVDEEKGKFMHLSIEDEKDDEPQPFVMLKMSKSEIKKQMKKLCREGSPWDDYTKVKFQ